MFENTSKVKKIRKFLNYFYVKKFGLDGVTQIILQRMLPQYFYDSSKFHSTYLSTPLSLIIGTSLPNFMLKFHHFWFLFNNCYHFLYFTKKIFRHSVKISAKFLSYLTWFRVVFSNVLII